MADLRRTVVRIIVPSEPSARGQLALGCLGPGQEVRHPGGVGRLVPGFPRQKGQGGGTFAARYLLTLQPFDPLFFDRL